MNIPTHYGNPSTPTSVSEPASTVPVSIGVAKGIKKYIDEGELNEAIVANMFLMGTMLLFDKSFDAFLEEDVIGKKGSVSDTASAALLAVITNGVAGGVATLLTGGSRSFLGSMVAAGLVGLPFAGFVYTMGKSSDQKKLSAKQLKNRLRVSLALSIAFSGASALLVNKFSRMQIPSIYQKRPEVFSASATSNL